MLQLSALASQVMFVYATIPVETSHSLQDFIPACQPQHLYDQPTSHVRIGVSKHLNLNLNFLLLLQISFNSVLPACILLTTINQVQWCMLIRNDSMNALPPAILSTLIEAIPLDLPMSRLLSQWNVKAPWHPFIPQARGTAHLPWYLYITIPLSMEQGIICSEFQELGSAIYKLC